MVYFIITFVTEEVLLLLLRSPFSLFQRGAKRVTSYAERENILLGVVTTASSLYTAHMQKSGGDKSLLSEEEVRRSGNEMMIKWPLA